MPAGAVAGIAGCLLLGVTLALAVAPRAVRPLPRPAGNRHGAVDSASAAAEIAQLRDALGRSQRDRDEAMAREALAHRDAEAASRAKDRLLATLGHELRNPLNGIVTAAEVLRAAPPASPMADSARDVLMRQVHKLTGMVDGLSDAGPVTTGPAAQEKTGSGRAR